jgi:single-strand DNA-binding protein
MTQLFGRMTADAKVNQLKDDREVVNFTLAMNDWYKPKGGGELVKTTLFVNCAYWVSSKIAPYLKKGSLVEVSGRLSVSAYTDMQGTGRASLDCHVNFIKIHHSPKDGSTKGGQAAELQTSPDEIADDLPF